MPPVRHHLVVYSDPTQAVFGTPQPCPNRGLDMVDGYEVIALTFILYFDFANTNKKLNYTRCNVCHRYMRLYGVRAQRLSRHRAEVSVLKETCGKDIILCSMIRPVGYNLGSGGHLIRACLHSADIDWDLSTKPDKMLWDCIASCHSIVATLIKRPLLDQVRQREARS